MGKKSKHLKRNHSLDVFKNHLLYPKSLSDLRLAESLRDEGRMFSWTLCEAHSLVSMVPTGGANPSVGQEGSLLLPGPRWAASFPFSVHVLG